jgi:hypothetical protein
MKTVAKKVVPKELLDGLLADYRKPEDLIGENGLLKQLTKLLVERASFDQLSGGCRFRVPPHPAPGYNKRNFELSSIDEEEGVHSASDMVHQLVACRASLGRRQVRRSCSSRINSVGVIRVRPVKCA